MKYNAKHEGKILPKDRMVVCPTCDCYVGAELVILLAEKRGYKLGLEITQNSMKEHKKAGLLRGADIAEAIDSKRGNEAEIAKAIRKEAND